jgi:hypothetical protein
MTWGIRLYFTSEGRRAADFYRPKIPSPSAGFEPATLGCNCKRKPLHYLGDHDCRSRVSSGSIVSDYGLDNRAIGVRSPAGAKDFTSSLFVQTGSGAYPASCTMGTGGPFSGGKVRPGRDADHSPPSSAEVVNGRSYTSPPKRLHGV